jgi:hypothetical protein
MALQTDEIQFVQAVQEKAREALALYQEITLLLLLAQLRGYAASVTDEKLGATSGFSGITAAKFQEMLAYMQAVLAAAGQPNGNGRTGSQILVDIRGV